MAGSMAAPAQWSRQMWAAEVRQKVRCDRSRRQLYTGGAASQKAMISTLAAALWCERYSDCVGGDSAGDDTGDDAGDDARDEAVVMVQLLPARVMEVL